jgi:uncharacterized protein (TIGR00255 family)
MTAYAVAEKTNGTLTVSGEIRSYNSRFLDITLKVPHAYASCEEKIKSLISKRLTRGRIETRIKIDGDTGEGTTFEIDETRAAALNNAVLRLKDRFDWGIQIPLDFLTGSSGVIRPVKETVDTQEAWPLIEACIETVLTELMAMRKTEGDYTAADINNRLDLIEKKLEKISAGADGLQAIYQQRLKDRIETLTRGMIDLDPARVMQETAILADKSDISEEIIRARSHLKQFRTIMASREPAGRKLNFLLQEFNREFNTMGSKSGNADISHTIVSVKAELEKIREQVQNVE